MENAGRTLRTLALRVRSRIAAHFIRTDTEISITSIAPPGKRARCWVNGHLGKHAFEALLYPRHATRPQIELRRSHIAKLCIRQMPERRILAAFDRGWELPPATNAARLLVDRLVAVLAAKVYGQISEATALPPRRWWSKPHDASPTVEESQHVRQRGCEQGTTASSGASFLRNDNMTETTYNGWANYETSMAALWLDNEQASYCYWRDQTRHHRKAAPICWQVAAGTWTAEEAAKNNLADQMKEEFAEAVPLKEPSVFSDLLWAALDEVNWYEIASNWLSEEDDTQPPEPVVYAYSRTQAIADGVLVEANAIAAEAGLKYPTALTAAAWAQCVKLPEQVQGQDERGRLWDVLWVLKMATQQAGHTDTLGFTVLVNNDLRGPQPVRLKAICGPGDDGDPVITVMVPEED